MHLKPGSHQTAIDGSSSGRFPIVGPADDRMTVAQAITNVGMGRPTPTTW